ncbi:hypothetical protein A2U01_0108263, partial [Trifolium medium]|nr:hypothetical protein [Trifolium medium]
MFLGASASLRSGVGYWRP